MTAALDDDSAAATTARRTSARPTPCSTARPGWADGGEAAPPGDDREPFDADASTRRGPRHEAVSFGGFADGLLAPLRTLSFWKMKDRARRFGESGGAPLLADLMSAAAGRGVRFHLMGHSFGCIVVSAAVAGPGGLGPARARSTRSP